MKKVMVTERLRNQIQNSFNKKAEAEIAERYDDARYWSGKIEAYEYAIRLVEAM